MSYYQYTVWGAEVFEGIEKKLQRVEDTVSGLAVRFRCNSTAQENVTGELTDIRDKSEFKLLVISLTCGKHEVTFFLQLFSQNTMMLIYVVYRDWGKNKNIHLMMKVEA